MKNYKNDKELLSAYLDNELDEIQKKQLEDRLISSNELRDELNKLKTLKELVSKSIKELPESPYLETRVMATLSENKKRNKLSKKLIPVMAIVILTIGLMIVFKYNPQIAQNLFENQKYQLANFYKQNLQPLFFASELSHEDVFNYAFYRQIPLNEKNDQYLLVGYSPEGKEYLEIKSGVFNPGSNNLSNFIKALDLNDREKKQMDSILDYYAGEIQNQILVNDKKTLAVNPKLWNLDKAIAADLCRFAAKVNKEAFVKILPASYNYYAGPQVTKAINEINGNEPDEYIFFTPDSVFKDNYTFDKKKFKEDMKKMKVDLNKGKVEFESSMKDLSKQLKELSKLKMDSNFVQMKKFKKRFHDKKIEFDSNTFKIEIPDIPDIELPDMSALNKQLSEAFKNLEHLSIVIPPIPPMAKGGKDKFKFYMKGDSVYSYQQNIPNVDSIIKESFKKIPQLKNFNMNSDSMKLMLKGMAWDSLNVNLPEFKSQMKELQKEMKKFKEEMKKMNKDLKDKHKKDFKDEDDSLDI